jgi:hypothetical protein
MRRQAKSSVDSDHVTAMAVASARGRRRRRPAGTAAAAAQRAAVVAAWRAKAPRGAPPPDPPGRPVQPGHEGVVGVAGLLAHADVPGRRTDRVVDAPAAPATTSIPGGDGPAAEVGVLPVRPGEALVEATEADGSARRRYGHVGRRPPGPLEAATLRSQSVDRRPAGSGTRTPTWRRRHTVARTLPRSSASAAPTWPAWTTSSSRNATQGDRRRPPPDVPGGGPGRRPDRPRPRRRGRRRRHGPGAPQDRERAGRRRRPPGRRHRAPAVRARRAATPGRRGRRWG